MVIKQATLESEGGTDEQLTGATIGEISDLYARRVIAAMINHGRFSYAIADTVANEHITGLSVVENPSQVGEYGIYATLTDVDELRNTRQLDLFNFEIVESHGVEITDEGSVIHSFAGFRKPEGHEHEIYRENGMVVSDTATKCYVEVVIELR